MKKLDIIIIGAGPAGLTCGYELLKKSNLYNVIILEESNDIGGISKTVNYNGNRMDIGGHRFFSKDKRVVDFWKNIMPIQGSMSYDDKKLGRDCFLALSGPNPEVDDRVMLVRNRVSRIYYLKKFFDYPISLKFSTFSNMGIIRTIESGFSYLYSCVFKKKEDSLENFYINRFGKKLYSMFFCDYTEKVWGRHPSKISADWGSQRVKSLSIVSLIKDFFCKKFKIKSKNVETSLIESFMYPKFGPGQLWENVASEIEKMGGKIRKNCRVDKINIKGGKIVSVVSGNNIINGDIFVSSMPVKDLIIGMGNKVPKDILRIAKGLPYRDFVTVGLLVKKLNLNNETNIKTLGNIVPDCWIYVQESNVKLGRIQIFNNWSPYMVKDPDNTVWLGLEYFCNEGDNFWSLSDNEIINLAIKELISMGLINNDDVLDFHLEKIKKAYPAYFDTYSEFDRIIDYLNRFNNLYCVGRNGQHRYNNMDHSMLTAIETVNNILNDIKDKSNIWNVNTEKEYHEEKVGNQYEELKK